MSQAWISEQPNTVKEARKEAETQAVQTLREAGVTQKQTANIVGVSERTIKDIDKETRGKIIRTDNFAPSPEVPKPSPEIAKTQAKAMLSEEKRL